MGIDLCLYSTSRPDVLAGSLVAFVWQSVSAQQQSGSTRPVGHDAWCDARGNLQWADESEPYHDRDEWFALLA